MDHGSTSFENHGVALPKNQVLTCSHPTMQFGHLEAQVTWLPGTSPCPASATAADFWVLRPTIGATHASPALQVPEKKSLATNTPG